MTSHTQTTKSKDKNGKDKKRAEDSDHSVPMMKHSHTIEIDQIGSKYQHVIQLSSQRNERRANKRSDLLKNWKRNRRYLLKHHHNHQQRRCEGSRTGLAELRQWLFWTSERL